MTSLLHRKSLLRAERLLIGAFALALAPNLSAQITAYEGFNYTPNTNLAGNDAPDPLTTWSGSATVDPAGLIFGSLQTSGQSARASGGGRAFVGLGSTVDSGVQYLSFLGSNWGNDYAGLELRVGTSSDSDVRLTAGLSNDGRSGNQFTVASNGTFAGSGISRDDNTHLFVIKIDYTPEGTATDVLSYWFDPTLDGFEPATPTGTLTGDFAFTHIGLARFGTGAIPLFDEIRMGTTFAAVTPIPEPSSALLAIIGGAGMLLNRRRQR
jgi:hypothetical protein